VFLVAPVKAVSNVGDIKCEICELIIKGLDGLIGQNASVEKINQTVYSLCNDLGGSFKDLVSECFFS